MSDKKIVKFVKSSMPYRKGESAGFSASVAEAFVKAGVGEMAGKPPAKDKG